VRESESMCVCVCVYVCLCVCLCVFVCVHACVHTRATVCKAILICRSAL